MQAMRTERAVNWNGEASSYHVDSGAWALFVGCDADRQIVHEKDFSLEFETTGNVMVAVVK